MVHDGINNFSNAIFTTFLLAYSKHAFQPSSVQRNSTSESKSNLLWYWAELSRKLSTLKANPIQFRVVADFNSLRLFFDLFYFFTPHCTFRSDTWKNFISCCASDSFSSVIGKRIRSHGLFPRNYVVLYFFCLAVVQQWITVDSRLQLHHRRK